MNKQSVHRRAFTLVELLLVITIVTVLMALLFPALQGAKNRGKDAKCMSNQRQINVGWGAFLIDHAGHYPYQFPLPKETFALTNPVTGQPCTATSGYSWTCATGWYYLFAPYINGVGKTRNGLGPYTSTFLDMMRCPRNPWSTSKFNDPNEYYGAQTAPGIPWSPSSYSLNRPLIPITWGLPQGIGPGCGYTWNSPAGWTKRTNINDIQHPSNAALMLENPLCPQNLVRKAAGDYSMDTPWSRANGPPGPSNWLDWNISMPFCGGGGLYGGSDPSYVTNYCNVADSRYTSAWLRPDCNFQVSTFHNLGMNVLFFDGHVDRISKSTLLTYSCSVLTNGYCGGWYSGVNSTPGGIFWTDGSGVPIGGRNYNQYAGYEFY